MIHPPTSSALDAEPLTPSAGRCPVHHHGSSDRKSPHPTEPTAPQLEQDAQGVWHVRGYHEARTILRGESRQAGFKAEMMGKMPTYMKPPVLFMEGEAHREQRRQTAKFFTPITTRAYHGLMERYADRILSELKRAGRADLSDISLKMAVLVAAQVIGLTSSPLAGMEQRIESFLREEEDPTGKLKKGLRFLSDQWRLGRFFLVDVLPAIRARQNSPQEDLITHLLDSGYGSTEILTECITYGAAGMATTREFISVVTWHLMEQPEMRAWYLKASEEERYAFLHELLRLEPVVGHLYRRTTETM
ncbi:MAG: cytochrome P450, partial [Ardenticatenales bacterium]|nr:cytochrome P450 [Ardenticatenales bacterium]